LPGPPLAADPRRAARTPHPPRLPAQGPAATGAPALARRPRRPQGKCLGGRWNIVVSRGIVASPSASHPEPVRFRNQILEISVECGDDVALPPQKTTVTKRDSTASSAMRKGARGDVLTSEKGGSARLRRQGGASLTGVSAAHSGEERQGGRQGRTPCFPVCLPARIPVTSVAISQSAWPPPTGEHPLRHRCFPPRR
jgi:hypothetical protein